MTAANIALLLTGAGGIVGVGGQAQALATGSTFNMQVLGIESSCDETAAAVVAETDDPARPWQIRSSVIASQVEIHREWGGVVPELASRQHIRDICGVVERALQEAGITLPSVSGGSAAFALWASAPREDPPYVSTQTATIDAIAVTQGPGLVGSLLVGLQFAKSLAASWGVPLVPVHHLAGHIESLFLHNGPLPLPSVVLVVSGGHTSLYLVPEPGIYRLIARTRDDAAGEAYDKVAKLLGLGYPGGPIIDRLAQEGNDRAIPFPMTRITHRDRNAPGEAGRLDFSFSGIKTAVMRHVKKAGGGEAGGGGQTAEGGKEAEGGGQTAEGGEGGEAGRREGGQNGEGGKAGGGRDERRVVEAGSLEPRAESRPFSPAEVADICASFQRVVVEALVDRLFEAAWRNNAKSVGIAGGVSANSRLRKDAAARGDQLGLPVFVPSLALTTDNAAMIAAAGLRRFRQGITAGWDLNADPGLRL